MTGAVSVGSGTYGGCVTGGGSFAALTTRFNRTGLGLPATPWTWNETCGADRTRNELGLPAASVVLDAKTRVASETSGSTIARLRTSTHGAPPLWLPGA